jgi:hypothetical protein
MPRLSTIDLPFSSTLAGMAIGGWMVSPIDQK